MVLKNIKTVVIGVLGASSAFSAVKPRWSY
jgi:hypothetical protein